MTREEAKHIVDVAFDVPQAVRRSGEDRTYHEDEIREAKEMAIQALSQESCEDTINRILKRMWNCRGKHTTSIDKVKMEQIIRDNLPSVTPEQKIGEWVDKHAFAEHIKKEKGEGIQTSYMPQMLFCNRCWMPNNEKNTFCPHCGAKMIESQESEGE